MKSVLAGLRNLVLPWGRTAGRRIVLDGDAGTITQYNDNGDTIIKVDDTGIAVFDPIQQSSLKLQPSTSAALVLHPPPIPGSNLFLAAGGVAAVVGPGPDFRPRMDVYSPGVSFGGTAMAELRLYGGGVQSTGSAMDLFADSVVISGKQYVDNEGGIELTALSNASTTSNNYVNMPLAACAFTKKFGAETKLLCVMTVSGFMSSPAANGRWGINITGNVNHGNFDLAGQFYNPSLTHLPAVGGPKSIIGLPAGFFTIQPIWHTTGGVQLNCDPNDWFSLSIREVPV